MTACYFCGSVLKRQSFVQDSIRSFWNECPNQDSRDIEHPSENCLVCGQEMSWTTVLGEKGIQEVRTCTNPKCKESKAK